MKLMNRAIEREEETEKTQTGGKGAEMHSKTVGCRRRRRTKAHIECKRTDNEPESSADGIVSHRMGNQTETMMTLLLQLSITAETQTI